MTLKVYRCGACDAEFVLTGDSVGKDTFLSCPSCLADIDEPVSGEDENDDGDSDDNELYLRLLARLFRRDDDD